MVWAGRTQRTLTYLMQGVSACKISSMTAHHAQQRKPLPMFFSHSKAYFGLNTKNNNKHLQQLSTFLQQSYFSFSLSSKYSAESPIKPFKTIRTARPVLGLLSSPLPLPKKTTHRSVRPRRPPLSLLLRLPSLHTLAISSIRTLTSTCAGTLDC